MRITKASILFLGALVFLSCDLLPIQKIDRENPRDPENPNSDKGSLSLTIIPADLLQARTIEPALDMTIATYDVSGSGPGSASFEQLAEPASTTTVQQHSLVVGTWTVTVDAKNAAGTVIGTGSATDVVITVGGTTDAEVIVSPKSGTGTLSLTVSWSSGEVTTPSVTGTLTPVGGTASAITFTLAPDSLSATSENTSLDAGYHTVVVKLWDGASEVWGALEVARIVAGQTTTHTFVVTDPSSKGSLNLTITPQMQNPITVTFSGRQTDLALGTDMTVTATTDPVADSYEWYLDGNVLTGQTSSSLTIGSALPSGKYRLDVLAAKGNILSADSISFSVFGETEMISVPAGSFQMGWMGIAEPVHAVTLSSFKIAKYEVTYDLWYTVRTWAISNGYTFANSGREGHDGDDGAAPTSARDEPVTYVSWRDAIAWCNALSELEGKTPCYYQAGQPHTSVYVYRSSAFGGDIGINDVEWSADGYRLPTESEWEYAARYVDGTTFTQGNRPSGATASDQEDTYAWYVVNSGDSTHPVGQKAANALGGYDMSGNVWEWCWDWYGGYGSSAETDPTGPSSGTYRTARGGGCDSGASIYLPCAYRSSDGSGPAANLPSSYGYTLGFRPVRTSAPGWNLSAFTYSGIEISTQSDFPYGLAFKPDGTKMYECGRSASGIYQYSLSTAWDLSTATYDSKSVASQSTYPSAVQFKADGSMMYELRYGGAGAIFQYTLGTAWDVSTASYGGDSFDTSDQTGIQSVGMFFSANGTKMYVSSGPTGAIYPHAIYQYSMSTAWDVTTADYDSVSISTQNSWPEGIYFSPDGTKLFELGNDPVNRVYRYILAVGWDLSTAVYDGVYLDLSMETPDCLFFKPDGTKMYVIGGGSVFEYSLP